MKVLITTEMRRREFLSVWETLLTKEPYKSEFKDVLHLVEIMLSIPVSSAECERIISAQNHIKSDERCCLGSSTLDHLVRTTQEGPKIENFDPSEAIAKWLTSGQRPRRCGYTRWPTMEDWCKKRLA